MKFSDIIDQARALLQRTGRMSYRALTVEFDLTEDLLDILKEELIDIQEVAVDREGKMLVWTGERASPATAPDAPSRALSEMARLPADDTPPATPTEQLAPVPPQAGPQGERRQLTVMFCDLVGSTPLSEQLDPEDYREVIQAYQQACGSVIQRWSGYIARYVGDGLLIYFGYPTAQEDAAARAVRAGLGVLDTLPALNSQFQPRLAVLHDRPLQVRIGIHTGEVVVGEMGDSSYRVEVAVGQAPNVAARIQGLASPNEVLISSATYPLVQGLFACQTQGPQQLKGVSTPLEVYHVLHESEAQTRFEVAVRTGLTPLVGRDEEIQFLRQRWAQVQAGEGQVVLLSGEAGIGKSRLVQELKDLVIREGATRIEYRCSPYHQNSALYPIITHMQRLLQFAADDTAETKLSKLDQMLAQYDFPQAETAALFAALLSLPQPEHAPALGFSPQKQKQLTQEGLIAWLLEKAGKATLYCAWEDLHWADPSTLEILTLLLDQVPTTRMLVLLTFRPEFHPPWETRSHCSQLTLSRLGQPQVNAMVERVTGGKPLPAEVIAQIGTKTDGVPLFVEELTKMVLESDLVHAVNDHYELTGPLPPLAIPSTLQDSLMARLDRLAPVRELAQIGAAIGREFSHEVIAALSPTAEETLQAGLQQLVNTELVYRRGLGSQATYIFKHALIQDTAYQSLLKSKRQQYHQQIARVLEERFAETVVTQPELVAHHYTEAGLMAQALPYWQRAGEAAARRSAHVEAINHISKGLELIKSLPNSPERLEQELSFLLSLGASLIATKGYSSRAVEQTYTHALTLCQQLGEAPGLSLALSGLWQFYINRTEYDRLREVAEQLFTLGQTNKNPTFLLSAHSALCQALYQTGEFIESQAHAEQVIALYNPRDHEALAFLCGGEDPGVACRSVRAWNFSILGYPDRALTEMDAALTLAREIATPFDLAFALTFLVRVHQTRGESQCALERAEEATALSIEQGFLWWEALVSVWYGWVLRVQGQPRAGLNKMIQGLAALRATEAEATLPYSLALLAEAYIRDGQFEEARAAIAEALTIVDERGVRQAEAELYRLKGELTLEKFKVQSSTVRLKLRGVFRRPSELPNGNRPNPGNCAPLSVSLGCGCSRGRSRKPAICSLPSTSGSPKGLTRKI